MTSHHILRLQLLGRFALVPADGKSRNIELPTRKTAALLAFVATSPDHTARREELADLLWGDHGEQQARQSLRQALALLRKDLDPGALSADARVIRLDPARWSIDVLDFEALVGSSKPEDLRSAAALFRGNFLAGLNIDEEGFDEWANRQRTRVQLAASRLCETFVRRPDLVSDATLVLAAVEQLTALDPLREDWHRLSIALYTRHRGKNEGLAQAKKFAGLLMRDLGVEPERETQLLIEQIKEQGSADSLPAISNGNAVDNSTTRQADAASASAEATEAPAILVAALPELASSMRRPLWKTLGALAIVALSAAAMLGLRAIPEPFWTEHQPLASSAQPDPWQLPPSDHEARLRNGVIPIVVLPFTVLGTSDPSVQLTADMLTDDLTNMMSHVPSFRVISRQTAVSYKGQAIDAARVGAELKVRYALEGSIRLQDNHWRINAALIDPATRLTVWSGRIERDEADRQGVRDEIAGRLARELQFEVLPIESLRLSKDFDSDALAYRGWAALSDVNLAGYKEALALFNQALERDPQNLSALIGVGAYHARMGAQALDTDPPGHRAKAREILQRALLRDPNAGDAHFYLGLSLNLLPTLPKAIEHFEQAIRINPSDASAHGQIGNGLIRSKRAAEGLEHVRYAMRLSPRDPIMPVWLEFAGNAELELADYRQAIAMFERSIAVNPRYPRAWAGLVAAHALAGDSEAARRAAENLKTFEPKLSDEGLAELFGRHDGSKLREGLVLAFALPTRSGR